MNAAPHTHEVEIREGTYYWQLEYGDQEKKMWKNGFCALNRIGWLFQRRMERKIKHMIKKHDKASVFAGSRFARASSLRSRYNEQLLEKPDGSCYAKGKKAWATDLLKDNHERGTMVDSSSGSA